jgi:two-component sensor histidine kinase
MGRLRTSHLPAQAVELRQWLLANGDELRRLRADLHQALLEYRLVEQDPPEEGAGPVVLVATELASNALRHGLPPAHVRLLRADGRFFLEVADRDLQSVPALAQAHHAVGGGRGLHIVRSLALEVCWYATERSKHVWASFPVHQPS